MLGEGRLVHWEKLGRAKRDSMYVHDFAWTLLSVMLEGMDVPSGSAAVSYPALMEQPVEAACPELREGQPAVAGARAKRTQSWSTSTPHTGLYS
jgi:hypothetical protein